MVDLQNSNPLLESYTIPPLDQIKPEHFVPALEEALAEAQQQFDALKDNTDTPDFENTVLALDSLFYRFGEIRSLLGHFYGSECTDAVQTVDEEVTSKIDAFMKTVFQDPLLAKRFKAITPPEAEEDQTLYKQLELTFEENGAFLDDTGKERISAIDKELISLASLFNKNMQSSTEQHAVLFTNPEDMSGLPKATLGAFRESAREAGHENGWLVVPERLQIDNLLEIAESRSFRQQIFEAFDRVGREEPHNNEPVIKDMQALRHERANLLGYPNYAEYAIARMMSSSVDEVLELFDKLEDGALQKFENTVSDVQAFASANGGPEKLEPWDIFYWARQYREETFSFDEKKFSEYLPLDQVKEGFFKTAEKIFGIKFEENTDYPRNHPDMRTYDVTDSKTGEHIGILYDDVFARKQKHGGAWMSCVQEKAENHVNIVSLNTNFPKPQAGEQALLTLGDLKTYFHEGGHALHGLLGTLTNHRSLQGPAEAASSDYIEFFSMLMEKMPDEKECLDLFAAHYKTAEPLPEILLEAKEGSSTFFSERILLRMIQNSRRDLAFHMIDPSDYVDSASLHESVALDHPLNDHIRAYPLSRFDHLFSSGLSQYASGYHGYEIAEGLSLAGIEPFKERGVFDPEQCEKLKHIYQLGSSRDSQKTYEAYLGKPLTPELLANVLLKSIGVESAQEQSEGTVRDIKPRDKIKPSSQQPRQGQTR